MNQLELDHASYLEYCATTGSTISFALWLDEMAHAAHLYEMQERVHYPDMDYEGEGYREPSDW